MAFEVAGVAPNDSLNLRGNIPHVVDFREAPVVGKIPHDASGFKASGESVQLENGSIWWEVSHGGVIGWANERYLARDWSVSWTPDKLNCHGTEPFWSFKTNGKAATFDNFHTSKTAFEELAAMQAQNRRDVWVMQWLQPQNSSIATAVVQFPRVCSNGMSDIEFSIEVVLLGVGEDGTPLAGCCSFLIE